MKGSKDTEQGRGLGTGTAILMTLPLLLARWRAKLVNDGPRQDPAKLIDEYLGVLSMNCCLSCTVRWKFMDDPVIHNRLAIAPIEAAVEINGSSSDHLP